MMEINIWCKNKILETDKTVKVLSTHVLLTKEIHIISKFKMNDFAQ